jgi:predicted RND superfamily exporter protein
MKCFFQRRDPWGHGLALWVLAALAFAAPLTLWALKGIRLDNDIQTWLPEDDKESKVFSWLRQNFPEEQRVIVAWEGSTLKDPRIPRFADALRGTPDEDDVRRNGVPYVDEVFTPQDAMKRMVSLGVEPDDALERLHGVLIGTGWLKVRMTDAGREQQQRTIDDIVSHAESRLGIDITVHEKVVDWIDEAYLAELDSGALDTGDAVNLMIPNHDFQVSWEGMLPDSETVEKFRRLATSYRGFATSGAPGGRQLVEDCFIAVGSPIAVAVTLSEAGGAEPDKAVEAILEAAIASGVPESALHIGGRCVTTAALNASVRKSAWNPDAGPLEIHKRSILLLSGVTGIVLAFLFLRSIRLGVLVVGTSWYATALSIGVIPITGATMNMVLVVMPTLLMVLALSSAIHVANYWKHAAFEEPATAVSRAIEMARQPCALAALTTAIGLGSLCFSTLNPVRDFGVYSALGCIVMLGVVLYGLPAMLQVWRGQRPSARDIDARAWKQFGILLHRHRVVVSLAFIALCGGATYGLKWFRTETKVVRYFPTNSRIVQDYIFLEENLAGVTPVDIIIRFDQEMQERSKFLERMEIVREIVSSVREHDEISGALSLAEFQPMTERPDADASRHTLVKYFRRSQAVEKAIKGGEQADSASLFVVAKEAADLHAPGDAALNGAGDELWRISAQASVMSDVNYSELTGELNERVQAVTRYYPGASHVVTGTVPLFLRTQEAVLESLIVSFGAAFGLIAAVMIWVLKDFWAGLLSMIPNILPVGLVFGALSWCGERVDVGTMITASVAMGIAVDGTLHLLTWFRNGLERGHSRFRSVVEALAHCAPALWQTSAAVGIGLMMLYPADLLLISRFGWLMAALIGAALAADLVLLPALLSGWLGALIERRVRARQSHAGSAIAPGVIPAPHFSAAREVHPIRTAG